MESVKSKTAMRFAALVWGAAAMVCLDPSVMARAAPARAVSSKSYEIDVPGTQEWVDTNLDVRGGARLRFTATGQITYPPDTSYKGKARSSGTFGPEGLPRGWTDLVHQYAVKDAGHGALIGRIGSDAYAQPFLVGASKEYDVPVAGRLFLGINQGMSEASTANGSFHVKVEVLNEGSADATSVGGPVETRIGGITPDLLGKIPRRVSDPNGKPGDMVNVLIVGSQDQVLKVFTAAGWVQVDKSVGSTMLSALMGTVEKKDYLTMPMQHALSFQPAARLRIRAWRAGEGGNVTESLACLEIAVRGRRATAVVRGGDTRYRVRAGPAE